VPCTCDKLDYWLEAGTLMQQLIDQMLTFTGLSTSVSVTMLLLNEPRKVQAPNEERVMMLSVTRSSLIKTTITLCICVLILAACGGDEEGEAPRIETGGSRTDGSPCDPGPCILINIVDFSNHVMDDNPFYALNSDGVSKLTDYIDSLQFGGNTAAHEAAYEGTVNAVNVDLGSGDSVRRTVVLFTDGLENASDRPDYLDDLHVLQDDSPDLFTFVTGVKGEDVLLGNNDFLNTLCEYIEHMGFLLFSFP